MEDNRKWIPISEVPAGVKFRIQGGIKLMEILYKSCETGKVKVRPAGREGYEDTLDISNDTLVCIEEPGYSQYIASIDPIQTTGIGLADVNIYKLHEPVEEYGYIAGPAETSIRFRDVNGELGEPVKVPKEIYDYDQQMNTKYYLQERLKELEAKILKWYADTRDEKFREAFNISGKTTEDGE